MNTKDSYKNPFADYNANVMDSTQILDFWCSPFVYTKFAGISETDIYRDKGVIVFMGGRGTGKTMFLRYWSYPVQRDLALRKSKVSNDNPIISLLNDNGGIGFYVRIDGPVLKSFNGCGLTPEMWDIIFTHYFELQICKAYIEVIHDLVLRGAIDKKNVKDNFVPEVASRLGSSRNEITTTDDLLSKINNEINKVTKFRGQIPFIDLEFKPSLGYTSQSLSFEVAKIAEERLGEFNNDINFVILIDEYENFLERQQRMVNTLLKFVKPRITFRIGMRLEGFRTFATISEDDFIMEQRDYRKFVFEDFLIKHKGYQEFLINVAKKRLEGVQIFKEKGFLDIGSILGKKEDPEKEAITIVTGRKNPFKHFDLLKNFSPKDIKLLRNEKNPLIEMLNILLVIRGSDPVNVNKQMEEYLQNPNSKEVKKYRMDYIDKYKLSLIFLLASIYRTNKKYYSFNTFCFLSSGIVGHFIELCRRSFQYAEFEEREKLIRDGTIAIELQDKAARYVANTQLQMITRIEEYGNYLYLFTMNLGNIFREYKKDIRIKYPETNQFSVDMATINNEYREAFRAALKWSIIQRKPGLQQSSPGKHLKQIYTLNRIFSPTFEITYRTRGGYSEDYNSIDIIHLMTKENVKPKMKFNDKPSGFDKLQRTLDLE